MPPPSPRLRRTLRPKPLCTPSQKTSSVLPGGRSSAAMLLALILSFIRVPFLFLGAARGKPVNVLCWLLLAAVIRENSVKTAGKQGTRLPLASSVPFLALIWERERSVLELRDVVCCYGQVIALKGVSLTVGKGQLVALIGANGAGKAPTLKAASGLLHPTAGTIVFDGHDITHASARAILALGLAHCPEGRHVFPQMTVLENLEMGCYLRTDRRGIAADLTRVFDQFPRLAERRRQAAGTLSGGEQQMLAIGRALMSQPKLIM